MELSKIKCVGILREKSSDEDCRSIASARVMYAACMDAGNRTRSCIFLYYPFYFFGQKLNPSMPRISLFCTPRKDRATVADAAGGTAGLVRTLAHDHFRLDQTSADQVNVAKSNNSSSLQKKKRSMTLKKKNITSAVLIILIWVG